MKHPNDHYYRLDIQYLGFRYHGWQRQPNVKTVQLMVEKTINYVLKGQSKFKVLASSRTDAMVSANNAVIQLIVNKELEVVEFLKELNINLPADIKALRLSAATSDFNAINDVVSKEYIYNFTFNEKPSPFSAPYIAVFHENLAIKEMIEAASLFEGRHNFSAFTDPQSEKEYYREVAVCSIEKIVNNSIPFFPSVYYALKISSSGFLKYQIRYIVGSLAALGKGEISPKHIIDALADGGEPIASKAPASGLVLNQITLKEV